MVFKVAVIYFSLRGRLVTLANVIAAGARNVRPSLFWRSLALADRSYSLPRRALNDVKPTPAAQSACINSAFVRPTQVLGAEVTVYRVRDPVRGDQLSISDFDDGVFDAPTATVEVIFVGTGPHVFCRDNLFQLDLSRFVRQRSCQHSDNAPNTSCMRPLTLAARRMSWQLMHLSSELQGDRAACVEKCGCS